MQNHKIPAVQPLCNIPQGCVAPNKRRSTPRRRCRNLLILAVLLLTLPTLAAPPPGVSLNGPIADWVRSWRDTTGFPCCGIDTDCRPTIIRNTDTGYEAFIGKEQFGPSAPDDWRPVPGTAFSEGSDRNPSGVSWACWYQSRVVCASLGGGF